MPWKGTLAGLRPLRDGDTLQATMNLDFSSDGSVCPFSALNEPHRSQLLAMLGPQSATPAGPSVPGYACRGYGARP
jgi:hypothetical protein